MNKKTELLLKRAKIGIITTFFFILSFCGYAMFNNNDDLRAYSPGFDSPESTIKHDLYELIPQPPPAQKQFVQTVLTINPGDTFYDLLKKQGVSDATVLEVSESSLQVFNIAEIRPGKTLKLFFSPQTADLVYVLYEINHGFYLVVSREDETFISETITGNAQDVENIISQRSGPCEDSNSIPAIDKKYPLSITLNLPKPAKNQSDASHGNKSQPRLHQVDVYVTQDSSLSGLLTRQGFSTNQIICMAEQVEPVYPLARSLQPGHMLHLWFDVNDPSVLVRMSYEIDSSRQLLIIPQDQIYAARIITGTLEGLFTAAQTESDHMAASAETKSSSSVTGFFAFATLFPEHFEDFCEPKPYDVYTFSMAGYENEEEAGLPSEPVDQDCALSNELFGQIPNLEKMPREYKPQLQKVFLAAPLKYRRISAGFSYDRKHPILGIRRPHLAIDFAAPIGTPVRSLGHGVITYKGYCGGYGNTVYIKHANGYITYYGHLSRFAEGLKNGNKVTKGQVIGYVGQSGLATGPHLDFRVSYNGMFINPLDLAEVKEPVIDTTKSYIASKSLIKPKQIATTQHVSSGSDESGEAKTSALAKR